MGTCRLVSSFTKYSTNIFDHLYFSFKLLIVCMVGKPKTIRWLQRLHIEENTQVYPSLYVILKHITDVVHCVMVVFLLFLFFFFFYNFLLRTYCKGVLLSKRRLLDVANEKLPCLEQNILIYWSYLFYDIFKFTW